MDTYLILRQFIDAPFGTLLALALVSGWTRMWLVWLFKGEVRHWIILSMPDSWLFGERSKKREEDVLDDVDRLMDELSERDPLDRNDIRAMSADELTLFIAAESRLPVFLRGVLTCRLCLSAYISAAGSALSLPLLPSWWLAPLVWGCAAYLGNRRFDA